MTEIIAAFVGGALAGLVALGTVRLQRSEDRERAALERAIQGLSEMEGVIAEFRHALHNWDRKASEEGFVSSLGPLVARLFTAQSRLLVTDDKQLATLAVLASKATMNLATNPLAEMNEEELDYSNWTISWVHSRMP